MEAPFSRGDYVRFAHGERQGQEGYVWEVTDQHLAIVLLDDVQPKKVPVYVEVTEAANELEAIQVVAEPPEEAFHVWRGEILTEPEVFAACGHHFASVFYTSQRPVLELRELVLTGVLGVSDGWQYSHRLLKPAEWQLVLDGLQSLDVWRLPYDDAVRSEDCLTEWYQLRLRHNDRQHAVVRSYHENEVAPLIKDVLGLSLVPGLTLGAAPP